MRIAVLAALILALSACSQSTPGKPQSSSDRPPETSTAPVPSKPPSRDSQLKEKIAWIQAGTQADLGGYHSASIDAGPATDLKSDIAFVSPSGKISCVTGTELQIDGLHCVVKLKNPVPKPGDGFGNWDGGYVHYTGTTLTVGQFRGDPGLFIHGNGRTLPYDNALTFGKYACRIATNGLTCVNATTKSGVQLSDDGIVPFGCLHEIPAARREQSDGQVFQC